jgi:hypothetical protein
MVDGERERGERIDPKKYFHVTNALACAGGSYTTYSKAQPGICAFAEN